MATPADLEGTTLSNQYRLTEVIGREEVGVVYRARQLNVARDVAIKVMHPQLATDERAIRRFQNEVRIISQLRHPNTLRLYDCQRTEEGLLYIVTELLSGTPLATEIQKHGNLDVSRTVRVLDSVCRSLSEAHGLGIVHRDLKPENVFVDRVGSDDVIKVLDFGIAKLLESRDGITIPGTIPGTPQYLSPEQIRGDDVDHRSDIYALGVMAYEMLSGQPPFSATNPRDIFEMHLSGSPPRLPGIPKRLEAMIEKMLAKRPEDRPQSVDAMRDGLTAALQIDSADLQGELTTVRAPKPAAPPVIAKKGSLVMPLLVIAAIALAAISTAAFVREPILEPPVTLAPPLAPKETVRIPTTTDSPLLPPEPPKKKAKKKKAPKKEAPPKSAERKALGDRPKSISF